MQNVGWVMASIVLISLVAALVISWSVAAMPR